MTNNQIYRKFKTIPTQMSEKHFDLFVLPHLSKGKSGPNSKLPFFKIFNYILKIIHTGAQWHCMPIEKEINGKPEIHFTNVYRIFQRWANDGSLLKVFGSIVKSLVQNNLLDTSILHGDGTTTAAKKGGDIVGYSGHKHYVGEKIVTIVDRNVNVIAPFITSPANTNESILFPEALQGLKEIAKFAGIDLSGSVMSLDSAYDSRKNRKMIFNNDMVPNIKENKRNRKNEKRGPKRIYDERVFQERFYTVERAFAWEDKFKRLLLRFEKISKNHFAMKLIAYAMINLRHFCIA